MLSNRYTQTKYCTKFKVQSSKFIGCPFGITSHTKYTISIYLQPPTDLEFCCACAPRVNYYNIIHRPEEGLNLESECILVSAITAMVHLPTICEIKDSRK